MFITRLILKRPSSAVMILLAIAVFGITSIFGFSMALIPDIEMPIQLVSITYPGADPQSVDELVCTKVEGAVESLSGVKTVTSYALQNSAMIMLQYDYGTDKNKNFLNLRAALDGIKPQLPEDCKDPVIMEMDINSMPSVRLTATADDNTDILAFLDDGMKKEIQSLNSVAQVSVTGGKTDYIRVLLKRDKLEQFGLSMSSVSNYIASTDFMIPVGTLEQGTQGLSATSSADKDTVDAIKRIPLFTSTGAIVTVADVADVSWEIKDATSISRVDGRDAVTLALTKNQSADAVSLSRDVKEILDKYAGQNEHITFDIFYNAANEIISSLKSVGSALLSGVILSMVVLFIFFGDVRASLVVGSSMPISLLITLILMHFMNFSLNVVTMGSLVIAIGMMVDSSIVVLESCFRVHETERSLKESALEGTRLVLSSIIASTITTIVVYLPLAVMKGLSGQMFSQLGYTIVFAMIASLLSAMAFVPLFFMLFRPEAKDDVAINHLLEKAYTWYDNNIPRLMYRKKLTVLVSIILLAVSLVFLGLTDKELMPQTESDTVNVTATYRNGTRLPNVDEQVQIIEDIITGYEDVKSYSLSIAQAGVSMTGMSAGAEASLTVNLKSKKERSMSVDEFKADLITRLKELPNVDVKVESDSSMSMSDSSGPEVVLHGYNLNELKEAASEFTNRISQIPGVLSVSSTTDTASTQVEIIIDPLMAANYGLTPAQVAGTMNSMVSGKEAMKFTKKGSEYSVFLEFPKGTYNTTNSLMNAFVTSASGAAVPISEIAELRYTDNQNTIYKQDGKYRARITTTCLPDNKKTVQKTLDDMIQKQGLPDGVSIGENQQTKMMKEEFTAIAKAIATAVFLIFLVMAIQFESPRFSLMVMLSIPFSMIGSFFLLFITGCSITMVSLMGILMLVGIVVNNGILYVDTANMLMEEQGMNLQDALVRSGSLRLRPILMTTLTTILSMFPMSLGIGSGGKIMQGMALIIIGGLITSTLLILLLLPSFYLIFYREKTKAFGLVE